VGTCGGGDEQHWDMDGFVGRGQRVKIRVQLTSHPGSSRQLTAHSA